VPLFLLTINAWGGPANGIRPFDGLAYRKRVRVVFIGFEAPQPQA
jgi:hypothetical protein